MTTTALATIPDVMQLPPKMLSRLRRRQLEVEERQHVVELIQKLLTHPVYSLVIGFAIIEYLESQQLMGNVAATSLEAGLLTSGLLNTLTDSGALQLLIPLFTKS